MKHVKVLPIILCLVCLLTTLQPAALAIEPPDVEAQAVVVADMNSGTILYEKNMNDGRSPASLTKIVTGLLAVEAVEQGLIGEEDMVTAPDDCQTGLDEESSTANPALQPGEQMRYIDVLYCALLASANEACNILAVEVSGSIANFVDAMNQKVRELGATNTRFYDTNGLLADNYTTAYDLSLITREAMKHPLFASIVNTEAYAIAETNLCAEQRKLTNSNALLTSNSVYGDYRYEGVSGVKTGYTSSAGYCLVSTCQKNGMNLLCIVLGCNGWLNAKQESYGNFTESAKLYDWAFENFSTRTVVTSGKEVRSVSVENARDGQEAVLVTKESVQLVLPNDLSDQDIQTQVEVYEEKLVAPIQYGEELGRLGVVIDGTVYAVVPLICSTAIEAKKGLDLGAAVEAIFSSKLTIVLIIFAVILSLLYILIRRRYKKDLKKHRIERARAEEKRNREREKKMTEAQKSRQQANSWIDIVMPDESSYPIHVIDPTERKPVETDLDALIRSLGLGDNPEDSEKK